MVDLGFPRPRFTWTNKRGISDLSQKRIDRVFVNPDWWTLFPKARVTHLTWCHSDHCPVLLESSAKGSLYLERPYKFQSFCSLMLPFLGLLRVPVVIPLSYLRPLGHSPGMRRYGTNLILVMSLLRKRGWWLGSMASKVLWPLPHQHLFWIWRKIFC